ncbi:MAG TPA: PQQ-dependent sugar dehydrogenase [Verrucomicrobiota bacterium]|nr:glycosyl hydrolase [Verrucomicrobiales bacterium]HRI14835.1 PQQ-dependent sugar dehydrogenase [Verrucomicrobiota bacterium]
MRLPYLLLTALALLGSAVAQQSAQTPTTATPGIFKGDNFLPPESAFRKVVLDEDQTINGELKDTLVDPMELAVARDGRVFFVERKGVIKMLKPGGTEAIVIAEIPVFSGLEEGMLGITLDPKFDENGWVYVNHSLPETTQDAQGKVGTIRVSRFTLRGDKLDPASRVTIFDNVVQREQCCHVGGSLAFDPQGNLYISIGDNTNPFDSDGFSPNDPRPGRYPWDAQRSAANANSLVGKILRIRPKAEGGYTIPAGNLFPPGTPGTRPEIYVMGNRNPFRISIDPANGFLYWGEVGPDSGSPDAQRGPAGFDEVNQARGPGFFGWPLFAGNNRPYAVVDYVARQKFQDAQAAREKAKKAGKPEGEWPPKPEPWMTSDFKPEFYDPAHPINNSPNNTGIKELPPAQPAFVYYPASPSAKFPVVGSGGRTAMAGPVYHFDEKLNSPHKLPRELDHSLFIYEWTREWIIAVKLDQDNQITQMQRFMPGTKFKRPMDLELGPDGCLYLIEFGTNWGDNKDSKIVRLEYVGEQSAAKSTQE